LTLKYSAHLFFVTRVPHLPEFMKNLNHRSTAGFTLVELLVVIVIIATLAALSFIGLARMRSAGDRAATIGIMRQLQIANTGYATDHNGQYVPIVSKDKGGALSMEWYRDPSFLTYLTGDPSFSEKSASQLLIAPSSILDPLVVRGKKRYWDRLCSSYGFNSTGLTYPTDDQSAPYAYRMSQIADPVRTAFMATATDYTVTYGGRNLWKSRPVEGKSTDSKMAFRHDGKAVIVYYDGSTGFITFGDLKRFDANGGIANPFWKATR